MKGIGWFTIGGIYRNERTGRWIATLVLVLLPLALVIRLLIEHGQIVVDDLTPLGSAMQTMQLCLGENDIASIGGRIAAAEPALCSFGLMNVVIGAKLTEIVGNIWLPLVLAGLGMQLYCRRLGAAVSTGFISGIIYELSPALLNQAQQGGPAILWMAASLPWVTALLIRRGDETWLHNGILLGVVGTIALYFDVQVVPFLAVAAVPGIVLCSARGNWRWLTACVGTGLAVMLVAGSPAWVNAATVVQGATHSTLSPVVQFVTYNRSSLSLGNLFGSFGRIGPVIGGALLLAGAIRSETVLMRRAKIAAVVCVVVTIGIDTVMYYFGAIIIAVAPVMLFLQNGIKFEVLIDFGLVIIVANMIQDLYNDGSRKVTDTWKSGKVVFALIPTLVLPVAGIASSGVNVLNGELGMPVTAHVPRGFGTVESYLKQRARRADYRVLFLPQSVANVRAESALYPNSLVDTGSISAQGLHALKNAYALLANESPGAALALGRLDVEFVVVDQQFVASKGANWELGPREVVNVANTLMAVGAPSDYLRALHAESGFVPFSTVDGWIIFRDEDWIPMYQHYDRLAILDTENEQGSRALREVGKVRVGSQVGLNLWTVKQYEYPVSAGASYVLSGEVEDHGVYAGAMRVRWVFASGHDRSWTGLIGLSRTSAYSVARVQSVLTAPFGAKYVIIQLLGGWERAPIRGWTVFRNIQMRLTNSSAHWLGVGGGMNAQATLESLLGAGTVVSEGRNLENVRGVIPIRSSGSGTIGSNVRDERVTLLNGSAVIGRGAWAFTADSETAATLFTLEGGDGYLQLQHGVAVADGDQQSLVWMRIGAGGKTSIVRQAYTGANRVACSQACEIADLAIVTKGRAQRVVRIGWSTAAVFPNGVPRSLAPKVASGGSATYIVCGREGQCPDPSVGVSIEMRQLILMALGWSVLAAALLWLTLRGWFRQGESKGYKASRSSCNSDVHAGNSRQ